MTPSGAVRKIVRAAWGASALVLALSLVGGCYGFSGGGGLPKQLKTVAIEPFDNQTAVPELQREVFEQLRAALRERLNLREAPAARADVVVRGEVRRRLACRSQRRWTANDLDAPTAHHCPRCRDYRSDHWPNPAQQEGAAA